MVGSASRLRALEAKREPRPRQRSGKWVVRWRAAGVHRSRSFTYKTDADSFDLERKRAREVGVTFLPERGSQTLAEFVEVWWADYAIPQLAQATRNSYLITWDLHIRPALGGYAMREITPSMVDSLRASLEANGVGRATVAKVLAILSGVFRFAVLRGLIQINPAREVRTPKARRQRFVSPSTPSSVERIRAELLQQGRLRDAVLVSVLGYSGVRPGEALGLRWGDVGAQTLRIERAVSLGEVKRTKTGRLRTVRLLAPLAEGPWVLARGVKSDHRNRIRLSECRGSVWTLWDWDNWRDRIFKRAAAAAVSRLAGRMTSGTPLPRCLSTRAARWSKSRASLATQFRRPASRTRTSSKKSTPYRDNRQSKR